MAVVAADSGNVTTLLLEQAITVWKRKWLALAVAWAVCLAGWAGVMLLPQRYESDARAFVDVNGLLTPLLRGLVVDTTPAQSENYLRQTLLSRPNLEQVIVLANLGGPSMTDTQKEQLVSDLSGEIKVTTEGNNLVSITYTDPKPVVAKNVVEAVMTIFAEKAATSSRAEMDKARAFLTEEIQSYETQLRDAEHRRAEFRKKYSDYFSDSEVARPEVLEKEVEQANQLYEDAIVGRNALQAQMSQIPQLLNVASAPTVSSSGAIVAASPEVRLAQAKRNLSDLRLAYTDKHPDVIAAERNVKELQAQVDAAKQTGGTLEGKTQISNPAYEQMRLKLVDAQTVIPTLKERSEKLTQEYARVKALSANIPEISAQSQDLDRDYDAIKHNYDELVKRREAANLSQAADDRADRTQFRIVDPPQVPLSPAFPNRTVLFSLVFLTAIIAGAAAPLGLAQIRPTFSSTARLRELGLPVIGAITYVRSVQPVGFLGRAAVGVFAVAIGGLILSYGGLVFITSGLYKVIW